MLELVEGGDRPSAALRVAGEPVARHQLEIAAAAGARRILVLGDPGDDRVEMMLGAARVAGLPAKIIQDAPALCAEVTAADELLVFGLPLDLNTATAEALAAIPGIGPSRSSAIVTDRDENGPFASVSEVERVHGIGPATVEKIRPFVIVGD